jgi:hypothetical protein
MTSPAIARYKSRSNTPLQLRALRPHRWRAVSFNRLLDAASIYVLPMSNLHNTNDKFFI